MSMLIEHMAICPFCGQSMIVESEGGMSGEELAEEARGRCGCDYAKEWRMKRMHTPRLMLCADTTVLRRASIMR